MWYTMRLQVCVLEPDYQSPKPDSVFIDCIILDKMPCPIFLDFLCLPTKKSSFHSATVRIKWVMFGIQCEKTYSIAMVFIITVYSTLGIEFIFHLCFPLYFLVGYCWYWRKLLLICVSCFFILPHKKLICCNMSTRFF